MPSFQRKFEQGVRRAAKGPGYDSAGLGITSCWRGLELAGRAAKSVSDDPMLRLRRSMFQYYRIRAFRCQTTRKAFVLNDDAVTSAKLQIRGNGFDEKKATSTNLGKIVLKT
jgi:hypothetical protein